MTRPRFLEPDEQLVPIDGFDAAIAELAVEDALACLMRRGSGRVDHHVTRLSRLGGGAALGGLQPPPPRRVVDIGPRGTILDIGGRGGPGHAPAIKARWRQHLDMLGRQFIDKARGHLRLPLPVYPPVGREADGAKLFGAGDPDIGQPPLFLEALQPRFVHRALRGEQAILPSRQKHDGVFQPLGAMQRHDRDLGLCRVAVIIHDQRDMFEKPLQIVEFFQRLDQFLQILQPPRRLGRLVVQPHLGIARFLQDRLGQFDMGLRGVGRQRLDQVILGHGRGGADSRVPAGNRVDQRAQLPCPLALDRALFNRQRGALHQRQALRARDPLDGLLRLVAQAPLGGVHDPLERQIIRRADRQAEIGHGITNLHPLIESRATDHAIGHPDGQKPILERAHLVAGAHQYRHLIQAERVQPAGAAAQILDLLADPARLFLAIPMADQPHLFTRARFGPQCLAKAVLVPGDHLRRCGQNMRGGTVILFQPHNGSAGEIALEAQNIAHLGPDKVPPGEAGAFAHGRGGELYALYQQRLKTLNAADFGDLLLECLRLWRENPDILELYQNRFRYMLVDEYQDTNVAQYLWLRLIAQKRKNLACVGDDDQSIYGWRGAEVGNILRFERDFPGAVVVRLEQNYRSTPHILAAASQVIAGNEDRLGKTLWTEARSGEKVRLIGHWDGEEEARWIGEQIEDLNRGTRGLNPFSLDQMAVLVRASHQMRAFEDRFLTIGLPYRVIGGPRFYERMEIRDAMAYFRLAVSPGDDLAFERIVNTPKRGLGDKAQQTIQRVARANDVSLFQGAALAIEAGEIKGKGAGQLRALIENIARWHRAVGITGFAEAEDDLIEIVRPDGDTQNHIELAEQILEESGYTEMWLNDKTPEGPGRLENLKELIKALENFENLQGFLEHISLIMDNDSDDSEAKVSIMTLHGAKGLEFPVVFLPGWEDGLFPSQRSMDETGVKGLEEERRLAYVGITRAEQLCTISFAANRRVYGQWQSQMPSRFVDELPAEHVEVLTPPGLYGGGIAHVASTIEERAQRADVYNSPGWRRLQTATERPVSQPREARNMVIDGTTAPAFEVGARVFHQKFGYGRVTLVEGDKLFIEFEKSGARHVVAKFIVPAEQADDVPF